MQRYAGCSLLKITKYRAWYVSNAQLASLYDGELKPSSEWAQLYLRLPAGLLGDKAVLYPRIHSVRVGTAQLCGALDSVFVCRRRFGCHRTSTQSSESPTPPVFHRCPPCLLKLRTCSTPQQHHRIFVCRDPGGRSARDRFTTRSRPTGNPLGLVFSAVRVEMLLLLFTRFANFYLHSSMILSFETAFVIF